MRLIVEKFIQCAKQFDKREALVTKSCTMTYGQLYQSVINQAEMLNKIGLDENEPIGIAFPNSIEFVVLLLACEFIGHPAVLLGSMMKPTEIEYHVSNTGLTTIFSSKSMVNTFTDMKCTLDIVVKDSIYCWKFDSNKETGEFIEGDFICQLTSGTNGASKGVVRTSEAVMCEIDETIETIKLSSLDNILTIPPIHHSYGLIGGTLAPLCVGAKVILLDGFIAADVKKIIKIMEVTILFAVPFMYHILNQSIDIKATNFANLRFCFSAGAPMSKDEAMLFYKKTGKYIHQDYGSTETGVMCLNVDDPTNCDTVGVAVGKRKIRTFDECGNPLPIGEMGEIRTKSLANARCYLYPRELNKIAYSDGWFSIGDQGKVDDKGYVYIFGRKSSMINVAGLKVDPVEVEKVIMEIQGVKEVVAVGIASGSCGQVVKAVIVNQGNPINESQIIQHCKKHLANYKVPRLIEFTHAIPRSKTGKILRKYLIDKIV